MLDTNQVTLPHSAQGRGASTSVYATRICLGSPKITIVTPTRIRLVRYFVSKSQASANIILSD